MEGLIIYPVSQSDKKLIESLLLKMKISFEKIKDDQIVLSEDEIKDIQEGLDDLENGRTFTSDQVQKIMSECLK